MNQTYTKEPVNKVLLIGLIICLILIIGYIIFNFSSNYGWHKAEQYYAVKFSAPINNNGTIQEWRNQDICDVLNKQTQSGGS